MMTPLNDRLMQSMAECRKGVNTAIRQIINDRWLNSHPDSAAGIVQSFCTIIAAINVAEDRFIETLK
jgi:hypothetical protein